MKQLEISIPKSQERGVLKRNFTADGIRVGLKKPIDYTLARPGMKLARLELRKTRKAERKQMMLIYLGVAVFYAVVLIYALCNLTDLAPVMAVMKWALLIAAVCALLCAIAMAYCAITLEKQSFVIAPKSKELSQFITKAVVYEDTRTVIHAQEMYDLSIEYAALREKE